MDHGRRCSTQAKTARRWRGGRAARKPRSTYSMHPSLAAGAATVVNSTTAASSHMPCSSRPTGPVNMSAAWTWPAVLTSISVDGTAISSRQSAVRLSASGVRSGSCWVWRSTPSQRRHSALVAGGSGGTIWNWPQSRHSRRWEGAALGATSVGGAGGGMTGVASTRCVVGGKGAGIGMRINDPCLISINTLLVSMRA